MADIIQLLPDSIANQIAAGEVIQRPASVVKELVENAIDAGASQVNLVIKDAGKTLIQVVDNGCGMSETDARMSFERHATSKIRSATDLFAIRTMGFRGEALASIAAVAHVEMRSRQHNKELGTKIVIEGSRVKTQEPCQYAVGTTIAVKNLFYNIPARRNFLKSDSVEMRHIIDEFQRIAIANPSVFFSLHHNDNELFHLTAGNLRQRLVALLGTQSNQKLVPVTEETEVLKLHGFVGKPEFAKKTRGDQYFYVNNRFIKSGYLHHAVMNAFEDLLPEDSHPLYFIFFEIDPQRIDINVHPTKQEIKFEDERLVYNYLRVTVRHALGQYAVTPSIDFDTEPGFNNYTTSASPGKNTSERSSGSGPAPFEKRNSGFSPNPSSQLKNWQSLYEGLDDASSAPDNAITIESKLSGMESSDENDKEDTPSGRKVPVQIHNTYIISHIKSGFLLIDQQAAHERILYERYLKVLEKSQAATQTELFAKTIKMNRAESLTLKEILPQVNALGFDIQEFGQDTFVIHGIPAELNSRRDEQKIIEKLIEQYRANLDLKLDLKENIARAFSKSAAIRKGKSLTTAEMQELIDKLFACDLPYRSPSGRQCFITFEMEDLEKQFD